MARHKHIHIHYPISSHEIEMTPVDWRGAHKNIAGKSQAQRLGQLVRFILLTVKLEAHRIQAVL